MEVRGGYVMVDYEGDGVPGTESTTIQRRTVLAGGGALVAGTALAGCIGDDGNGGGETNVAIISSPAGFDDNAFNDNAVEGLEEAANDFDLEYTTVEETEEAQYESTQADTAESGYDLIICVGDNHTDPLETNAEQYPDQNWMLINNVIDGADNVSGWIEMNNEMSFLAGVVAGVMTDEEFEHDDSETDPDESIVGFVGGEDIPLINAFEQSYIEGVEWVNDDAEVLTGYGGSFSDTGAANDVAESQIDDGADIVWHAASAAGAGAFSAAQDNDRFALGVDVDQSVTEDQYQDVILGSAVKALNEATYQVAESVVEDDFESQVGEQNLSVEQGSIDFVVGQAFEGELPDDVDQYLDEAREGFENDEIDLTCGPTSC
ncbi:BMP family ABC transporter substrate-binding protein [Natronorubrum sp. JWXQ-INN-674]|uniref:BMP family ABC transporter substrate-binding protein n=2 Tax=Natronorubrum halalkaliphilum TaxID=2691917 RepID=A0A6B0VLP2_9EURY|nr:BMP family ABC transporter substrate-binding protein [Natronorubrum halalkaliphilum]